MNVAVEKNRFRNGMKTIKVSEAVWDSALDNNLANIIVRDNLNGKLITQDNHEFINMCSCSYLGLDVHPKLIEAAIDALRQQNRLLLSISAIRIKTERQFQAENILSEIFGGNVTTALSASAASAGVLPLIASGYFTKDVKPVMVFDKKSHFSMAYIKPICADETDVLTCEHNDLDFLEDVCKKHKQVAYIADGAYSMGGCAPVKELLALQQKYGLFLYFDDAHSVSIIGETGEGLVRSSMDEINDLTIIAGSLGKAFGAAGGYLTYNNPNWHHTIVRYGGPLGWSQPPNEPALGAIIASAEIHKTSELTTLQQKLNANVNYFDSKIITKDKGNGLPVRLIPIGCPDKTMAISKELFRLGYYVAPVFFPGVPRGQDSIRIMIRADIATNDLDVIINTVKQYQLA